MRARTSHRGRRAERRVRDEVVVQAPENFSLIENAAAVLRYIELVMRRTREARKVRLDFRRVTHLTPDAAALLIAKSRERRLHEMTRVRVSKPMDEAARKIWNDSGLTEVFSSSETDKLPDLRGKIIMKSQVKVDSEAALFLREFAEKYLRLEEDTDWLSIQTILLEAMANTVNHSEGAGRNQTRPSKEPWYAAVYCDEASSRVKFTFLDTGVGILESLRKKPPAREALLMKVNPSSSVLRKVMEGVLTSSTGLKHRGEGLPEIRTIALFEGQVDRLVIITNDVYADIVENQYSSLPVHFHGTVLYWEKIGRWKKRL